MTRRTLADMNAQEIHAELVHDALVGVLTPLDRFVAGCERIAQLRGISADDAYKEVRGEALSEGAVGVFLT